MTALSTNQQHKTTLTLPAEVVDDLAALVRQRAALTST